VQLFLTDGRNMNGTLAPIRETLTRADGSYHLCLPAPIEPSGATGPDGQPFEVRVRKEGYRIASRSFRHAYSVWDYGGVEASLELVRD